MASSTMVRTPSALRASVLVANSPWGGAYYASADAFYNNGETTGTLIGTPPYDPAVPEC